MPAERPRALISWSSGKDAAYALHLLRRRDEVEVAGLITTVAEGDGRVAVHRVRAELLARQAALAGLPLLRVPLPEPCPDAVYLARTGAALERARAAGVSHVAFGDLHLTDIRAWRERQMGALGLTPLFPLWGLETGALARAIIDAGIAAVLTAVDPARLAPDFAGRHFDRELLAALPAAVDPCGENGEFHTVCLAGPMFQGAIAARIAEPRPGPHYVHADVIPEGSDAAPSP